MVLMIKLTLLTHGILNKPVVFPANALSTVGISIRPSNTNVITLTIVKPAALVDCEG